MSESWIDPASLEGDALRRWYLRSPADVERERQKAAARRYQDFFYGGEGAEPTPGSGPSVPAFSHDIGRGFATPAPGSPGDTGVGFTWVATGPNRFRGVRTGTDESPLDAKSPGTDLAGAANGLARKCELQDSYENGAPQWRRSAVQGRTGCTAKPAHFNRPLKDTCVSNGA